MDGLNYPIKDDKIIFIIFLYIFIIIPNSLSIFYSIHTFLLYLYFVNIETTFVRDEKLSPTYPTSNLPQFPTPSNDSKILFLISNFLYIIIPSI